MELKIKAEREAMEARLQLEENRQKWATVHIAPLLTPNIRSHTHMLYILYMYNLVCQAHMAFQEGLAGVQKQTLEGLQEATVKMMNKQAEAVQHTADAARHIKEVTMMLLS